MARFANAGDTIAPRTIIPFGDSRTKDAADNSSLDWLAFGQALVPGGQRFKVIRNAGISGNNSTQMLARIQADVFDYSPDAMTLWTGNNDNLTNVAAVDADYAIIKEMVDQATKRGIVVFLISEIPNQNNGLAYNELVQYLNTRLAALAATTRGVVFVDFNSVITDPLDAAGKGGALYYRDFPHLSPWGAYQCGKAFAGVLASFPPINGRLLNSIADQKGTSGNSPNVHDNGFMQGSGGSKGAGHTGTLANSHTTSGAATAVLTTPARSDGRGNNQVYELTAASGTDTFTDSMAQTNSRYVPGRTYQLSAALQIVAASNLKRAEVSCSISYSSGQDTFGINRGQNVGTVGATEEMALFSPEFTIPPGNTVTSVSVRLLTEFSAAGSATINLGRLALREIPTV